MKMMKMAALGIAVLALAGLAGCNNRSAQSKNEIVIRFNTLDSGTEAAPMRAIAERYMRENPGIRVELEEIPDNYDTKILAQISSNTAADLIQLGYEAIDFGRKGIVEDLTPRLKAAGWDLGQYIPSTLIPGQDGAKLYALPKDYSSFAICYNKKIFDAKGVPYPADGWTWDECIETARSLTDPADTRWGIQFQGSWPAPFEAILYSYGGEVVSPDGKKYGGFLDSPASVRAFSDYVKWHTVDKVSPTPAQQSSMSGVDLFATGRVAMYLYGPWDLELYSNSSEIDLGTVRLPQGPAGRGNSLCWLGYGINAKSKVKDEAFKFLTYFCGPVGSEMLTAMSLPAVKPVNDEFIKRAPEYLLPWLNDIDTIRADDFRDAYFLQTGNVAIGESLDKLMQEPSLDAAAVLRAAAAAADKTLADLN